MGIPLGLNAFSLFFAFVLLVSQLSTLHPFRPWFLPLRTRYLKVSLEPWNIGGHGLVPAEADHRGHHTQNA